MVTMRKLKGLAPFSQITNAGQDRLLSHLYRETLQDLHRKPERFLIENDITKALRAAIVRFSADTWCVDSIDPVAIMPDHIHLIIRIRDTGDQMALGNIVRLLMRKLATAYWGACGKPVGNGAVPPVFERDWHDWIVKRDGQFKAFSRYVAENPFRLWLRQRGAEYFHRPHTLQLAGRRWFAYGNEALLDLPVVVPVVGHRRTQPGSAEWNALVKQSSRIGPGGAGISTFMSPLEKECGNAIAKAGGSMIVLVPDGFGERWHPSAKKEKFCAEGRMLFLSLYPSRNRQLTNAELHERCHEMGDLVGSCFAGSV